MEKLFKISQPYGYHIPDVNKAVDDYNETISRLKDAIIDYQAKEKEYKAEIDRLRTEVLSLHTQLSMLNVPDTSVEADYLTMERFMEENGALKKGMNVPFSPQGDEARKVNNQTSQQAPTTEKQAPRRVENPKQEEKPVSSSGPANSAKRAAAESIRRRMMELQQQNDPEPKNEDNGFIMDPNVGMADDETENEDSAKEFEDLFVDGGF